MTATNHILTGSVFALATSTVLPWWVILPVAFLLHFVLDSLPHFGQRGEQRKSLERLKLILPLDAAVAASILLTIVLARPEYWLLAVVGGIMCASPDLWSATRYIRFLKHGDVSVNKDWFAQFHHKIQWGERLWGAWIELAWFLTFGFMLLTKL